MLKQHYIQEVWFPVHNFFFFFNQSSILVVFKYQKSSLKAQLRTMVAPLLVLPLEREFPSLRRQQIWLWQTAFEGR